MPKRYPVGRPCEFPTCENELTRYQARFCSKRCANTDFKGKRRIKLEPETVLERLPTDDEVWEHKYRRWSEWGKLVELPATTLSNRLKKRGWKKNGAGLTVQAPCRICKQSFAVTPYTMFRICPTCRIPKPIDEIYETVKSERKRRRPGGDRYHLMYLTAPCYTWTRFGKAASRPGLRRDR